MNLIQPEPHCAHPSDDREQASQPGTWAAQLAGRHGLNRPAMTSDEANSSEENAAQRDLSDLSRADANALLRRVVGERIVEARRLNGFDQMRFAQKLAAPNSTQLSLWEQGKRLPPLSMLIEVARVLGVSLDYLVAESEEPERDAKLAARAAVVRRVERLLKFNAETVAECLLDACTSPAADYLRVSRFASRAHALCEAVDRFEKLNTGLFEDARAGATLLRTAREMRDSLQQVERFLSRAEHSRTSALQRARTLTQARRHPADAPIRSIPTRGRS